MSRDYNCILVDDELLALSYLRTLCEEIPGIRVLKAYDNPQKLIEELPVMGADFCISDVVMPAINGLELARHLKHLPIIFTTAHNEFAADAFDIDAVDYLRKPVRKQRLEQAIEKVIRQIRLQEQQGVQLSIQTAKGKMIIQSGQIALISSETIDRRDKLMTLKTGETWVIKNTSFDQLLERLPEAQFCRISRGEIIAIDLVKGHTADSVLTAILDKTGKNRLFSLGVLYREAFLQKLGSSNAQ